MLGSIDWMALATAGLGFAGGLVAAFLGAWLAIRFQQRHERENRLEAVRFRVFMKLIELKSPLFWLMACELRKEGPKAKYDYEAERMAWQISDMIRLADDLEPMDRILRVLFSKKYSCVKERYEDLEGLLGELARQCNPRYCAAIQIIGEENMRVMEQEFRQKMLKTETDPPGGKEVE